MRINMLFVALWFVTISSLFAQTDSSGRNKTSIHYFNSFSNGALIGGKENGVSFSFSSIHGIRRKVFAAGVGIGYDSYERWRMFPLFGSLSADLFKIKGNALMIQANAGHTFVKAPASQVGYPEYHAEGGVMINPMIGYRIHANQYRLYFLAGYKYQSHVYSFSTPYWYGDWGWLYPADQKITIEENLNRLTIQIGFGWN